MSLTFHIPLLIWASGSWATPRTSGPSDIDFHHHRESSIDDGTVFEVESTSNRGKLSDVSKVQEIEAELEKLSPSELGQVRDWLEDFLEDQLQFTDQFEAQIRQSEQETASGMRPRVRQPGSSS